MRRHVLDLVSGATDGYFGHWQACPPVVPNFKALTGKRQSRRRKNWLAISVATRKELR